MIRIEDFIAGHHGHQILRFGQIDDVMCPAWNHVNGLDMVAAYLEFDDFARIEIAFLDEAMP